MQNKDDNMVIEYNGKLYKNYYNLFEEVTDFGENLEGWDNEYIYAMERWIITHVLKLQVTEHKVQ